jgi:hypothetical protein
MKKVNQRLKRLTETDFCKADAAEKYRNELLQLANETADAKTIKKKSNFFKALSDGKRLRIVKLLRVKEMCVCELMICLDPAKPFSSHPNTGKRGHSQPHKKKENGSTAPLRTQSL